MGNTRRPRLLRAPIAIPCELVRCSKQATLMRDGEEGRALRALMTRVSSSSTVP